MRSLAIALLACACALGCKRTETPSAADTAPEPPATLVTASDPFAPPPPITAKELPPSEGEPVAPIVETVTADAGGAPVAAPSDPFAAVIASVQQSAVGCFKGLPPGDYNATIDVVVTAAGTATRVTTTSGPSEPEVRKCLEQAATRGYPSSASGRKLSIDVRVKG